MIRATERNNERKVQRLFKPERNIIARHQEGRVRLVEQIIGETGL